MTLPSGEERYIQFRDGEPTDQYPDMDISFEKEADLFLIRIGDERSEIPDAVVFGG